MMVVLPPDKSGYLFNDLGVGDTCICLVHGTLIAGPERWNLRVVPQAASLVACLSSMLASGNVENQGITRYLLGCLDLDDVTALKTAPIAK